MEKVWICMMILGAYKILATEIPVVRFQTSGLATEQSSLIWKGDVPEMTKFTLCMRLKILQERDINTVISYSVPEFDNEIFVAILVEDQGIQIGCCNGDISKKFPMQLSVRKWTSFCVAVDVTTYTVILVNDNMVNTSLFEEGQSNGLKVRGGGLFVIGQEQDQHGGSFDKRQSLRADVAEYMLFDKIVSNDVMFNFTSCLDHIELETPLIQTKNVEEDFTIGKDIWTNSTVERQETCSSKTSYTIYFPEKRNFADSALICHAISGRILTPANEAENLELFNRALPYERICKSDSTDTTWLGATYDTKRQTYVDYLTGDIITFYRFYLQPSDDKMCTTMYTSLADIEFWHGMWKPRDCKATMCTSCHVPEVNLLSLRGLCSNTLFDNRFFIYGEANGKPLFNGLRYSVIQWVSAPEDPNTGFWELSLLGQREIRGRMRMSSKADYPMGVKEWTFEGDECPSTTTNLAITTCHLGQYTCRDGSCIDLSNRCDLAIQCPDGSDEDKCQTVNIESGYIRTMPPPRAGNAPVLLLLGMVLGPFKTIDINNFRMTLDVTVTFSWHDSRINFRNLKGKEHLNKVSLNSDSLWMPPIDFVGERNASIDVILRNSDIMARRLSEPLPPDSRHVSEGKEDDQ